jgi:hypothetical protein
MPVCESCRKQATWRNGDGSFACSWHKDGITAVYLGKNRRVRLAEWAKNLPDEGTVKLMRGTYLHSALLNAFQSKHRFTDLRDNANNASGLQKAMILGLIELFPRWQLYNDRRLGGNEYFLTDIGREAIYTLAHAPANKFIKVAYKKNKAWADHAQVYCW